MPILNHSQMFAIRRVHRFRQPFRQKQPFRQFCTPKTSEIKHGKVHSDQQKISLRDPKGTTKQDKSNTFCSIFRKSVITKLEIEYGDNKKITPDGIKEIQDEVNTSMKDNLMIRASHWPGTRLNTHSRLLSDVEKRITEKKTEYMNEPNYGYIQITCIGLSGVSIGFINESFVTGSMIYISAVLIGTVANEVISMIIIANLLKKKSCIKHLIDKDVDWLQAQERE